MKNLTYFRSALMISVLFGIYAIWKLDGIKFHAIFFASCFFIFIFSILIYYFEKHKAERSLTEKIFDEKAQNIDSNVVEIIKAVGNFSKK